MQVHTARGEIIQSVCKEYLLFSFICLSVFYFLPGHGCVNPDIVCMSTTIFSLNTPLWQTVVFEHQNRNQKELLYLHTIVTIYLPESRRSTRFKRESIIYVNDMPNPSHHQTNKSQFADDAGQWAVSKNMDFAAQYLQRDLDEQARWCSNE